ncbi:hypothetical protein JCM16408A_56210 [Methylobacterium phyllosphaerae]
MDVEGLEFSSSLPPDLAHSACACLCEWIWRQMCSGIGGKGSNQVSVCDVGSRQQGSGKLIWVNGHLNLNFSL